MTINNWKNYAGFPFQNPMGLVDIACKVPEGTF
ncbi:uncharacterized protein METZ01_LOCUS481885, partial [marine metagenome]